MTRHHVSLKIHVEKKKNTRLLPPQTPTSLLQPVPSLLSFATLISSYPYPASAPPNYNTHFSNFNIPRSELGKNGLWKSTKLKVDKRFRTLKFKIIADFDEREMLGRAGGEKVGYRSATTKKEIWRLVLGYEF